MTKARLSVPALSSGLAIGIALGVALDDVASGVAIGVALAVAFAAGAAGRRSPADGRGHSSENADGSEPSEPPVAGS